jgi:hypothetical protein
MRDLRRQISFITAIFDRMKADAIAEGKNPIITCSAACKPLVLRGLDQAGATTWQAD